MLVGNQLHHLIGKFQRPWLLGKFDALLRGELCRLAGAWRVAAIAEFHPVARRDNIIQLIEFPPKEMKVGQQTEAFLLGPDAAEGIRTFRNLELKQFH